MMASLINPLILRKAPIQFCPPDPGYFRSAKGKYSALI